MVDYMESLKSEIYIIVKKRYGFITVYLSVYLYECNIFC